MIKLYRFIFRICIAVIFSIIALGSACAQRVCTQWGTVEPFCTTQAPANCRSSFPGYQYRTQQDCCGAKTLLGNVNFNPGFDPSGIDSSQNVCGAGCVLGEMSGGQCGTTEHQTSWYVFDIHPVAEHDGVIADSAGSNIGDSAGTLRFKVIPCDIAPNDQTCSASQSSEMCNCDLIGIENTIDDDGENNASGTIDYDWALYKVTSFGANKAASCAAIKSAANVSSGSVKVACNYAGSRGTTGMFEPGDDVVQNAGGSRYCKPIKVNVGDRFVLAVDNFTTNLKGNKIIFSGTGWQVFNSSNSFIFQDSTAAVFPTRPRIKVISGDTARLCPGDSVTLGTSYALHYLWSTGDTTQTIKVSSPGVYSVKWGYYNVISAASPPVAINFLRPLPAPVITYSNGMIDAGNPNLVYNWYQDGVLMPGYNAHAFFPLSNGTYTASVTGANTCTSALSEPFIFTGTSADLYSKLKITPNPATNTCRITGLKANALVEIYSVNGKFISAVRADSNTEIDLQGIPAGVYEIRVGHQRLSLVKN